MATATRFLCLLLLFAGTVRAENWSQLTLGMSPDEARRILGEPILRSAGQGFETWIYDHQAEVVFYGSVVGWTTPRSTGSTSQSVDVWQPAGEGQPTIRRVLPRPQIVAPSAKRRVAATKAKVQIYR